MSNRGMRDRLIITLPYHMRTEDKEILRKQIIHQMEEGDVICLPCGSKVLIAPPDLEVIVEEAADET